MARSDQSTGLELVTSIRATFPEVAESLDEYLYNHLEYDDTYPLPWALLIEQFSQLTTNAIRRTDEQTASAYLTFMDNQLRNGNDETRTIIDTYYVESLLWDVKDLKTRKWGWSLIPDSLKSLYVALWGPPGFKK